MPSVQFTVFEFLNNFTGVRLNEYAIFNPQYSTSWNHIHDHKREKQIQNLYTTRPQTQCSANFLHKQEK